MINNGELCHWGIKGMRWGVRRYMNKDGTLTNAGKKRYAKELAKVRQEEKIVRNKEATKAKLARLDSMRKNVDARKQELDNGSTMFGRKKNKGSTDTELPKRRKISELTDDELRAKVNRLQLEQQYKNLRPTEEHVQKGKGFLSKFKDEAIKPAAINAGRDLLQNLLKKKGADLLGLNEKQADDGVAALKKEWEKLNYQDRIKDLKKKAAAEKASEQSSKSSNSSQSNATTDTNSASSQRSQATNPYTDTGRDRVQYLLSNPSSASKSQRSRGEQVVYDILDEDGNYITTKRYRQ